MSPFSRSSISSVHGLFAILVLVKYGWTLSLLDATEGIEDGESQPLNTRSVQCSIRSILNIVPYVPGKQFRLLCKILIFCLYAFFIKIFTHWVAYFCIIRSDGQRQRYLLPERNDNDQKGIGKQNQEIYFKTKSNSFGVAPGDQPPEILPH